MHREDLNQVHSKQSKYGPQNRFSHIRSLRDGSCLERATVTVVSAHTICDIKRGPRRRCLGCGTTCRRGLVSKTPKVSSKVILSVSGTLAAAIGMPLIAMNLSAYRLVPRNIVLACDGSPLCISVHSSRTDGTMTAVGGKSNLTDWKIQYT